MKNFTQQIGFKIPAVIFIILMLVSTIIYNRLANYVYDKAYQDKIFDVKDEVFSLQETLTFLVSHQEKEQIQKTIAFLGTHLHLSKAMLISASNRVISSSRLMDVDRSFDEVIKDHHYERMIEKVKQAQQRKKIAVWYSEDKKYLYAIAPIITVDLSAKIIGQPLIDMLYIEYKMQHAFLASNRWFNRVFISILFALFISAILIATYIHFYISRRIITVQKALENVDISTKPTGVSVVGEDEISAVTHAFNTMVAELHRQNQYLNQYKYMISLSSDMQALFDNDLVYLAVNKAYATKFNLTIEKIVGKHVLDIIDKECFESKLSADFERCLKGETVKKREWRKFPTGNAQFIEGILSPYYQEDGEIHGITVNYRDITKLKRQQEEVEKANTLLSNVINSTSDLVFAKNIEQQYILANNAFSQSLSIPLETLIGKTDQQLNFTNEQVARYKIQDNDVLAGKNITVSYCASINDQNKFHDTNKSPLRKGNGEIIGIIGIGHDVTEHITYLAKISKQQEELSQVIDAMFDAVITIDAKGIIQHCNKSTVQLFGYEANELIGHNISKLMPENVATEHDHYLENHAITGEKRIIGKGRELVGINKNQQTFPLHLAIAELPHHNDEPKRFVGVCRDLSEIKRHEKLLNRTQKMEALGQLTGGIAHDYNNVLGVIIGYSDILKTQLKEQPKLLNFVEQINQAGNRGAQLTRKLLSFSRQSPESTQAVNLNDVILSNKDVLQKTLLTTELRFMLEDDLSEVNIDKNSFEDVLLNMAINAMHAMPKGGLLTLSTQQVTLSQAQADSFNIQLGQYIQVSIEDNGIGMSKAIQDKIFEPFFSTKGEQGSGLGLAQVYGFMKSSSGAINVYSEIGEGTRFLLYFPINSKLSKTENNFKNDNKKHFDVLGNETILVVDDEPQLITLAQEVLIAQGYRVLTANNGVNALEVLKKNTVDLLLSDIIMPKINGYLLVEQVTKRYPQLKIILTSGFQGDHSNFNINLEEDIITKPYDNDFLLSRIRGCLDKQTASVLSADKQSSPVNTTNDKPIVWTSEMSIDDGGMLDDDHKELCLLLNRCQRLLTTDDFHQPLQEIIKGLINYTQDHFAREELAMKICHYPYAKNHSEVHQMITKKLMKKITHSSEKELLNWLTTEMSEWLIDHIIVMDKPLQKYLLDNKENVTQALNNKGRGDNHGE